MGLMRSHWKERCGRLAELRQGRAWYPVYLQHISSQYCCECCYHLLGGVGWGDLEWLKIVTTVMEERRRKKRRRRKKKEEEEVREERKEGRKREEGGREGRKEGRREPSHAGFPGTCEFPHT
jgi:hypothetical protein